MQEDALLPHLTPRETLHYSLDFRVSELSIEPRERQKIINNLIKVLNLTKCADTRIVRFSSSFPLFLSR
jgi:ABC-type multidrug transport system ATPase subunit